MLALTWKVFRPEGWYKGMSVVNRKGAPLDLAERNSAVKR